MTPSAVLGIALEIHAYAIAFRVAGVTAAGADSIVANLTVRATAAAAPTSIRPALSRVTIGSTDARTVLASLGTLPDKKPTLAVATTLEQAVSIATALVGSTELTVDMNRCAGSAGRKAEKSDGERKS